MLSVHPGDRYPLGRSLDLLNGGLQGTDGLVDVVVDDNQVEVVAVGLFQHFGLFGESLQAAVELKYKVFSKILVPKYRTNKLKRLFRNITCCGNYD